jgi:hypothetical protein
MFSRMDIVSHRSMFMHCSCVWFMRKEEKVVQFKIALEMSSIAIHVTDKLCPQVPGNLSL